MLSRAKEKMAALDERIMAKVDEKIDRVAAGLRKPPGTSCRDSSGSAPNTPPVVSQSPAATPPLPRLNAPAAAAAAPVDAAAAAKAFASVPKEELVGLLHKTNTRCKQLEMRYAELQRLHQTLLEEKRQLVATRGRASSSIEAERELIEATLKQGYEERLTELEEHVTSSTQLKQQLQAELERASVQLRDEAAGRQQAVADAAQAQEEAKALRTELDAARTAAEQATREAAAARAAAAAEQATLLERVMQLQGEAASLQHGAGGSSAPSGACPGNSASEARVQAIEAARKAEREEALAAQQRLRDQLAAGEAALAQAQGQLSAAHRAQANEKAAAEEAMTRLHGELESKEKALSRALSNYKEEVGRWGERIQAVEKSKTDALATAEWQRTELIAEWKERRDVAVAEAERIAAESRVELEAELAVTRSTAAADQTGAAQRLAAAERRLAEQLAVVERERDAAVAEAKDAMGAAQQGASARLRSAEEAAGRAKASEANLIRERDELARKNVALQTELRELMERTSQQVEKWAQHSASTSEHEAVVSRLRAQVEEMEVGYREAKGVKASLEAQIQATKRDLAAAQEDGVQQCAAASAAAADADAALSAKDKEAQGWKAKWKAQAATASDTAAQLEAAEQRILAEAAAHAAALATRDQRLRELETQLESGRPQEQTMFSLAREQAKRDEEVGRLRGQLKSLRDMLKESHKVLKHLMRQEQLLKEELHETRRTNERADTLNVDYLKNVLVAFLTKVYGDADDEEHIKLARVLQTILHFSPEDTALVNEKIEYYETSWWHRTANLLKADSASTVGTAPGSSSSGSSWFGSSWFG